MLYHLDTIPVWDAIKQNPDCPLCLLREKTEQTDVERFLGGSVMEPDTRIMVNEKGFCPRHHEMLYALQNRLGHALLMQTRLHEVREKVLPILKKAAEGVKPGLIKGDKSGALKTAANELQAKTSGCVICESVARDTERYARTLIHLYKTDEAFRRAFAASKGVCMRDLPLLMSLADETLRGDTLKSFLSVLYETAEKQLAQDQSDIDYFCTKFDYRNQDKPWGTSRGSLERTVNRLRGHTLKEGK